MPRIQVPGSQSASQQTGDFESTVWPDLEPDHLVMLWMDEIHFAPPKRPWRDDSPVNTNKQWFPILSIHRVSQVVKLGPFLRWL